MSAYKFIGLADQWRNNCARCHLEAGSEECEEANRKCGAGTIGHFTCADTPGLLHEEAKAAVDEMYPDRLTLEETVDSVRYSPPSDVSRDKKYDEGKPMVGQMKRDFPRALLAVADVTRYGIEKYNQPGSWKEVKDAFIRYEDALGRHDLMGNYEDYDGESGRRHLVHRAWNALATLELILMEEADA